MESMNPIEQPRNHLWVGQLIRGLLAIIFGIALVAYPSLSLMIMIAIFGAFVFLNGLFAGIYALWHRKSDPSWGSHLIEGVIGIIIGLLVWFWPGLTGLILLYIIAAWAIATGIMQLVSAISLRKIIRNAALLGVTGLLSLIFGVLVCVYPVTGAVTIAWIIGIYAIIIGLLLVMCALSTRKA
ncbi:MAG: hypothetical protein CMF50_09090 [Legionellales bacterium]|nr:hypothetical protein [Legionellales bacterium]